MTIDFHTKLIDNAVRGFSRFQCCIQPNNDIDSSVLPHQDNCHHSFLAPVVFESARRQTAESMKGNKPSQSPLW